MATSEPWLTLGRGYDESVKTLRDPEKEVYVAYQREKLAGFVIINMKGALRGYIQTVCILPAWRGQGIGSKLILFAEERIFRESPNVFMFVSSFNLQAQKLYERLGYEVVGTLKNYFVTGHDEILLRKTLAPWSEFQIRN
jgi:ribosomal protein S18 acetylase RimI-like enzyme